MRLHLESRWPSWARWRSVTARPHGERYAFNPKTRVLCFWTELHAKDAKRQMEYANGGEYRIVPCDCEED